MSDQKLNDVFERLLPQETQVARMFDNIEAETQRPRGIVLRRRPMLAVCSLVLILALAVGVFPSLHVNDKQKMAFTFEGLVLTAAQLEESGNDLVINTQSLTEINDDFVINAQPFKEFSKVEITVSEGALYFSKSDMEPVETITLQGGESIIWENGYDEGGMIIFHGYDLDGALIVKEELTVPGYVVIYSYPPKTKDRFSAVGETVRFVFIDATGARGATIQFEDQGQWITLLDEMPKLHYEPIVKP